MFIYLFIYLLSYSQIVAWQAIKDAIMIFSLLPNVTVFQKPYQNVNRKGISKEEAIQSGPMGYLLFISYLVHGHKIER